MAELNENPDINSDFDMKNICRTCLKNGELTNLFSYCQQEYCLIDKLMYCTFINIKPNDGLPTKICSNCILQLNKAFNFAKNCERADDILRKSAKNDETISENIENQEKSDENIPVNKELVYLDHTYVQEIKENADLTQVTVKKTKSGPPYLCKKCHEEFPVFHLLKEHYKMHKTKEFAYTKCKICSKTVTFNNLKQHLNTHSSEKQFCCEYCGKKFNHESNFRRHRRIHTGEKPYQCDFCDKSFNQSTSMKEHRRVHTGEKPFICNYCGKAFRNFGYFNYHIKSHVKDRTKTEIIKNDGDTHEVHQCEYCSQLFSTMGALRTHLVTHGNKNFICQICGRGFIDSKKLSSHLKIHNNERNFACNICNKKFLTALHLKNHKFRHTAIKPYACDQCDKTFVQIGHLKYHLRIHTNERPFSCQFCGKSFRLNGNLTVHIRTHTKETPHVCKICDKGFCDTNGLKKHMKTHHSD